MKRPIVADEDQDKTTKKIKTEEETTSSAETTTEASAAEEEMMAETTSSVLTDENLLHEILKHVDARSLATASCVNKQWHSTAQDERLWELVCTRHWASTGCGREQLRSVVLALGGFRRLHSLYLRQLSKPEKINSNPTWPCKEAAAAAVLGRGGGGGGGKMRWGKDEVHLSLSLLSIRYYEKMNFSNRGKGL